jgi:hypothetical protein
MFSWRYISFNFYNLANGGPKIKLDQRENLFVFNKSSFWNDEGEGYLGLSFSFMGGVGKKFITKTWK